MISWVDIGGIMTKQSNKEKPTGFRQEEQEISPARKQLEQMSKKVPHPGTVRVTIFPNPRERRFVIHEDANDNKNH
jgi:hypothetical protein